MDYSSLRCAPAPCKEMDELHMQKIASEITLQQIRVLKQKVPSSDVVLELEFTVTNFPSFVHVISKQ